MDKIQKVAEPVNILIVCSEAQPFAATGGLADVTGSLPKAINNEIGAEARVIMPLYENINCDLKKNLKFVTNINVPVAWRNQYCGLFTCEFEGVVYYFIDNEYYFKRYNLYGYYDDGERFTFLSRAVLELLPHLDWKVDVLHCHDWHTALVPIYYKMFYKNLIGYENVKSIFTIHNIEYQGQFSLSIAEDVFGISRNQISMLEFNGQINLLKGALELCDVITTVSPSYASELIEPFHAYGLDCILRKNSYKLKGILNGIDVDYYNPATNPALFVNYDKDNLDNKLKNKLDLQKMIGLPVNPNLPLIGIVSRLAAHKGLELVKFALHDILKHDVQMIILGTGDQNLEDYLQHIQIEYDKRISTVIAYNKDLSQKIYAGADIFLMPSKSEPCGLAQMIACRYGTVPVVRATGGLKDTIKDSRENIGNGFVFEDFDVLSMTQTLDRAIEIYNNHKEQWRKIMLKAMSTDFSWKKSAKEYIKLYRE